MRRLFGVLTGIVAIFAFTTVVSAAKPSTCATIQGGTITSSTGDTVTVGYDQWGYNYQANMFNGWYDNYSRPTTPITDGAKLMMKWNNAWLSNQDCDFDGKLDRHYGYPGYIDSGAWLTNHAYGTYTSEIGYKWDISGDWEISVNGVYNHDYTFILTSLPDGTFIGTGGYPANAAGYIYDEIVVNGLVDGDIISFTASYYINGIPTGYVWHAIGTINSSGALVAGTGDAGVVEWHSTMGSADKVYDNCEWSDFVKIVAVPHTANLDGGYWYSQDGVEIGPSIWGSFAIIQEISSDSCGEFPDLMNYSSELRKGVGNWEF